MDVSTPLRAGGPPHLASPPPTPARHARGHLGGRPRWPPPRSPWSATEHQLGDALFGMPLLHGARDHAESSGRRQTPAMIMSAVARFVASGTLWTLHTRKRARMSGSWGWADSGSTKKNT